MVKLQIQNQQRMIKIPTNLKRTLKRIVHLIGRMFDLSEEMQVEMLITDDQNIRRLNRRYRGVKGPTDVLSFSMREGEPILSIPQAEILGDIVISAERAETQARTQGHTFQREMEFLTIHAMLHLLGYDHELKKDAQEMNRLQKNIMRYADILRKETTS